jgi:dihydroceramide fatty acyl 2-hydroxylase
MELNTSAKNGQVQHYVSAKDESVPMFKNKFIDYFSRVHWITPVIAYVPLIGYLMYQSWTAVELPFLADLGIFVLGLFFWSFFEYIAHRFVFHYHPTSKWGKRLHFMLHGVHHDYPNDSMRLVMPVGFSLPLAAVFYWLIVLIPGYAAGVPFFAGFVFGYLSYDMLHYATHHAKFIKAKWFQKLKKHHMDHHFKAPDEGFGVSSPIWDFVFGTYFKK